MSCNFLPPSPPFLICPPLVLCACGLNQPNFVSSPPAFLTGGVDSVFGGLLILRVEAKFRISPPPSGFEGPGSLVFWVAGPSWRRDYEILIFVLPWWIPPLSRL